MAKRYTPKEKLEFNRLFLKDFMSGLTVEEISKRHGVSTASIYQWKRKENEYITQLDVFRNFKIEIDNAIKTIENFHNVDTWALRDAVFRIAVWIRWPNEPHTQRAMLITCASNYLRQHCSSTNLQNLNENEVRFLFNYVDLEFLGSIATPDAPFFEYFNIITHGKSRYSDLDFYSEFTRYLLSSRADLGLNNKYVKIENAHYLIEKGAFGPGWVMLA